MQAGVEPLRRVGRGELAGQHKAEFIVEGVRIGFAAEVAVLPAPVGPATGQAVKHLPGISLGAIALIGGQGGQLLLVRFLPPQPRWHPFFLHRLERSGDTRLAEVFLGKDVNRHLRPGVWHHHVLSEEDHAAVGVADPRGARHEVDVGIRGSPRLGKQSFDFHCARSFLAYMGDSRDAPTVGAVSYVKLQQTQTAVPWKLG